MEKICNVKLSVDKMSVKYIKIIYYCIKCDKSSGITSISKRRFRKRHTGENHSNGEKL